MNESGEGPHLLHISDFTEYIFVLWQPQWSHDCFWHHNLGDRIIHHRILELQEALVINVTKGWLETAYCDQFQALPHPFMSSLSCLTIFGAWLASRKGTQTCV